MTLKYKLSKKKMREDNTNACVRLEVDDRLDFDPHHAHREPHCGQL